MTYSRVRIPTLDGRNTTTLQALTTTVERFGWEVLDDGTGTNIPNKPVSGPYTGTRSLPVRPNLKWGTRMEISLHAGKHSRAKGKVFRFRVTSSSRKEHLVLIALATKGDWGWMTDMEGKRISRDLWLDWARRGGVS
jgi:hypothetical protein